MVTVTSLFKVIDGHILFICKTKHVVIFTTMWNFRDYFKFLLAYSPAKIQPYRHIPIMLLIE